MTESEIWQIIQTGNEISVMRTEVFITITVGVLIISSLRAIRLTIPLLILLLVTYLTFGYLNFNMLVGEMEILLRGMEQLRLMRESAKPLSLMGHFLADQISAPLAATIIPALHIAYWSVSLGTVAYSIWKYMGRDKESPLKSLNDAL
jgi:hypothetical protein